MYYFILKTNLFCHLPDKYQSQFGGGTQYTYYHEEDENTFHLVDTARVQKPPYQRGRHFRQGGRMMRGQGGRGGMSRLPGGSNQFQTLGKLNKLQRYYITTTIGYIKYKYIYLKKDTIVQLPIAYYYYLVSICLTYNIINVKYT